MQFRDSQQSLRTHRVFSHNQTSWTSPRAHMVGALNDGRLASCFGLVRMTMNWAAVLKARIYDRFRRCSEWKRCPGRLQEGMRNTGKASAAGSNAAVLPRLRPHMEFSLQSYERRWLMHCEGCGLQRLRMVVAVVEEMITEKITSTTWTNSGAHRRGSSAEKTHPRRPDEDTAN